MMNSYFPVFSFGKWGADSVMGVPDIYGKFPVIKSFRLLPLWFQFGVDDAQLMEWGGGGGGVNPDDLAAQIIIKTRAHWEEKQPTLSPPRSQQRVQWLK